MRRLEVGTLCSTEENFLHSDTIILNIINHCGFFLVNSFLTMHFFFCQKVCVRSKSIFFFFFQDLEELQSGNVTDCHDVSDGNLAFFE